MMRHILALAGLSIGALAALPADAETSRCAPRAAIVAALTQSYGESRQSIGLGNDNAVVEVFASAETGSWTILVTHPNGMACLMAAGQGFEHLAEAPVLPGEPA